MVETAATVVIGAALVVAPVYAYVCLANFVEVDD